MTAQHEETVAAARAELLVTVRGSSLLTGRAALKKAKEAQWLAAAIAWANTQATSAAAALGTRVVGIHRLVEDAREDADRVMGRSRAPSDAVELGFDLGNEKPVGVEVTIQHRVEGFSPPPSAGSGPQDPVPG